MAAISAFLGRDEERARLAALVPARRLVTVVGPGGIGKTRLAYEVCEHALAALPGTRHRCELASVAARDDIGAEVAGQLGFPSLEAFLVRLGDEPALLVLDNCEHVRAAAAALCRRLLDASPALRIVATSREPLGVDGEEVLPLGPLALPPSADRADVDAAPATRLFEERARSAGARPPASDADFAAIAELCRRLDGVPLAIELAAARARSLTPAELIALLDRRFDVLRRDEPVGRARHRSLRAAIDASYGLLDAQEQSFFRALGVFAGPFDADLAHAVAAGPGVDRLGTLDLLARLVDRSLVAAEPHGALTRYRLLDSLRHYAAERAREAGEWAGCVDRFVDAMAAHADGVMEAGMRRWTAEVMEALFAHLGNFFAAIDRCLETDLQAARAFRILLPCWGAIHQGRATEVAAAGERVLARWPEGAEPLRAEALAVTASASLPAGRFERAQDLAERVLGSPAASPLARVIALRALGVGAMHRGEDAASAHFRRGAAEAYAAELGPFARELVVCAAVLEGSRPGALDAALAELGRACAEATEADDRIGRVWALVARTHLLVRAERLVDARAALAEAERAREGFTYPYGAMVIARLRAALIGLERGWAASCHAWRAALDVATAAGELAEIALTLRAAAALARRAGDVETAARLLAAVPAGTHLSVNGDVFDDPEAGAAPAATADTGALRRARERLAALAGGAAQAEAARAAAPPADGGGVAARDESERGDGGPARDGTWPGGDGGAPPTARGAHEAGGDREGCGRAGAERDASERPGALRGAAAGRAGAEARATLARTGDVWTVRFAGRETQLRHVKGLADLAALLARPGEELHCLQLAGGGADDGDAGPLLDARARAEYQARVRALQAEIDEAHERGDPGGAERAEAELDALVRQLSAAFGLGGRARRAGAAAERARSAVAWRIRAALKRIATAHPELGRHLENAVRTGTWCCYRPETDVSWDVRPGAETRGRSA